jgi:hypothetical protein
MKLDLDSGLKGLVINHKPLTEVDMKRLLLIFDELYFLDPRQNMYFLKEGSICYTYEFEKGNVARIVSSDGFEILKRFSNLQKPDIGSDLKAYSLIHEGQDKIHIVPTNMVPYYNGREYKKQEERLLEKLDSVYYKKYLNVINPDIGDFNIKNSINLKIAYESDISDRRVYDIVSGLIERVSSPSLDNYIINHGWLELPLRDGVKLFPNFPYVKPFSDPELDGYNAEQQYMSIVAKFNKNLAMCGTQDLIPIFIDKSLYSLYRYKIDKSTLAKDIDFNLGWSKRNNVSLSNLHHLLLRSSITHISDIEIKRMPLSKIIRYKEEKFDKLYNLRKELYSELNDFYSLDIGVVPLSEIEDYVNRKIFPLIKKQEAESTNLLIKKFNRLAILGLTGVVTTSLSFTQGLSPLLISLLSGLTPLLGEGLVRLSSKLEDKKLAKYQNTFSYFLDLKNKP